MADPKYKIQIPTDKDRQKSGNKGIKETEKDLEGKEAVKKRKRNGRKKRSRIYKGRISIREECDPLEGLEIINEEEYMAKNLKQKGESKKWPKGIN